MSSIAVTSPIRLHRNLRGFVFNSLPIADLIDLGAVIALKDYFRSVYFLEFLCTSMNDVPKTSEETSAYSFFIKNIQTLKTVGKRRQESSSKKAAKKLKGPRRQRWDDDDIVEVTFTCRVDGMLV